MAGPILYSTNPSYAYDVGMRYRGGKFFVWCGEEFDSRHVARASGASLVAASSDPRTIYEQLAHAVTSEDHHDSRIKGYRRTFKRLAAEWASNGLITAAQRAEIEAVVKMQSWTIWRPLLYVIPRAPIESRGGLVTVAPGRRAAAGIELQIMDLDHSEFDKIELPRLA